MKKRLKKHYHIWQSNCTPPRTLRGTSEIWSKLFWINFRWQFFNIFYRAFHAAPQVEIVKSFPRFPIYWMSSYFYVFLASLSFWNALNISRLCGISRFSPCTGDFWVFWKFSFVLETGYFQFCTSLWSILETLSLYALWRFSTYTGSP